MVQIIIDFKKLKNQDPLTLKNFYRLYKDKVYTALMIKSKGDEHLADDILSETFVTAISNVKKLRNDKNIQGWLLRIAHTKFVDHIRKEVREDKIRQQIVYDDIYEEELFKGDSLDDERAFFLQEALRNLKDSHRKIIIMKYMDGKTHREIAESTESNIKGVESLVYRAKEKLLNEYKKVRG